VPFFLKKNKKQENNFDHSTRDCAKFIGSTIFILLWQLGTRFSVTHHYYYPFAKDEVLEHHTSKSCDDLLDKHEGLRRIRPKKQILVPITMHPSKANSKLTRVTGREVMMSCYL
jgi:hypothetical protein